MEYDPTARELSEALKIILDICDKNRWGAISDITRISMLVRQLERIHKKNQVENLPDTIDDLKRNAVDLLKTLSKKTPTNVQDADS